MGSSHVCIDQGGGGGAWGLAELLRGSPFYSNFNFFHFSFHPIQKYWRYWIGGLVEFETTKPNCSFGKVFKETFNGNNYNWDWLLS